MGLIFSGCWVGQKFCWVCGFKLSGGWQGMKGEWWLSVFLIILVINKLAKQPIRKVLANQKCFLPQEQGRGVGVLYNSIYLPTLCAHHKCVTHTKIVLWFIGEHILHFETDIYIWAVIIPFVTNIRQYIHAIMKMTRHWQGWIREFSHINPCARLSLARNSILINWLLTLQTADTVEHNIVLNLARLVKLLNPGNIEFIFQYSKHISH